MDDPQNAIQRSIQDLLRRGRNAHVLVDATRDGVEVPDHVREQWKQRLMLDLNPDWPMGLDFDEQAFYADLGFQGVLMRCRIPFRAVWAVMDTKDGNGFVFHSNLPPELAGEFEKHAETESDGATVAAAVPEAGVEPVAATARPTEAPKARAPKAPASKARRGAPRLRLVKGGKS